MDTDIIITGISSFIVGGGLLSIITLKSQRKKAAVEVKVDEIKALHDTIELVYEPLVKQQKERIQDLESEVKTLREQLSQERSDRQREINLMNERILAITSMLGIKNQDTRSRDEKGRFTKAETGVEESN